MINILLPSGETSQVDNDCAHLAEEYKWYAHKTGRNTYARGYRKGNRMGGLYYLHRLVVEGGEIDHIDGNGLNNTKSNLRAVDRTQNNHNRAGVRGCYYEARTGKWRSEIWHKGIKYRLGRFDSPESAQSAYLKKKMELLGEGFVNAA